MFVTDTGVAEAWDVTTRSKAFSFTGQDSKEESEDGRLLCVIALNADGSRLAGICGSGRNVTLWDTASRSLLLKLPEEQSAICCLAWNPHRESLAVGTTAGMGSLLRKGDTKPWGSTHSSRAAVRPSRLADGTGVLRG
jgi:WD40 repeat protein